MRVVPLFITIGCVGLLFPTYSAAQGEKEPVQPVLDMNLLQQDLDSGFAQLDQAFNQEAELSPEEAYYLGRAVAANILEQYTLYGRNPALIEYLNLICSALVINSAQPVIFNGYHVLILDTQEINAFATSGGHIFISLGLVEAADSEDTLAAVIAHEIAHIQLRHGLDLMQNMRLTQDLSASGVRAADIAARGTPLQAQRNLFADQVREMVNVMVVHGYSQAQEFEADSLAMDLLAVTGYEPTSLIEMLQTLETAPGGHLGGFAKTHPAPALRIAQAKQILFPYSVPDTRSFRLLRYYRMRE
ncbi:MAG: M48 family metalloprotease [Treponema sp.]|jgi:predicted Zn-dependent protease|nr:M48 family metalloprotease [Treponema sp.]